MKHNYLLGILSLGIGILLMTSCNKQSIPQGATAVDDFDVEQYLGTWYEIARLDFKYEKNLKNVTAQYSLRDDGKLKVVNQGYNYIEKKKEKAEGKARFRGSSEIGELEVSFFGPFYASYNVIDIKGDYQYALVAGNDLDNMWILSRTKTIPENVKEDFLKQAEDIGYDISDLIWVDQD